jgi:hypothetical protein
MGNEPFHERFICTDASTCYVSDICIINWYFTLFLLLLVLSKFGPGVLKGLTMKQIVELLY